MYISNYKIKYSIVFCFDKIISFLGKEYKNIGQAKKITKN